MAVKSYETLIKLQKAKVDEQRIHLARLQDRLDQIDGEITQLEIRKARELDAARDTESRTTYGAFLIAMVERGRILDADRQAAAIAVKIAHDKLSELFEEQKRYEIAEEQRLAAIAKEERRQETIELDEIGGITHERNK